jgi:hypothetical protein
MSRIFHYFLVGGLVIFSLHLLLQHETPDSFHSLLKTPPAEKNFTTKVRSFTDILIASGSDKYFRHHYERYYEVWLEDFRRKSNLRLLEIGADTGASLNLWAEYFTDPDFIMGLAYGVSVQDVKNKTKNNPLIRVYYGDQASKPTMDYLRKQGPWDIIIDDGSHVPSHVTYSFFSLWKSVKYGGIYIVEDLETNYWRNGSKIYGYDLFNTGFDAGPQFSFVTKLQQIQHVLVRHQIGAKDLSIFDGDHDICSVEWGMNLVMIRKCDDNTQPKPPYQALQQFDVAATSNWLKESKRSNPNTHSHGT